MTQNIYTFKNPRKTLDYKLQALNACSTLYGNNLSLTARIHGLSRSSLYHLRKNERAACETANKKGRTCIKRKQNGRWPELDTQLFQFFQEEKKNIKSLSKN